jgi:hypothetical protein
MSAENYRITPTNEERHHKRLIEKGIDPKGPAFGATFYDPARKTTIGYGLHTVLHNVYDDESAMSTAQNIAKEYGYKLLRLDRQKPRLIDIFVSSYFHKYFPGTSKTEEVKFGSVPDPKKAKHTDASTSTI